MQPPKIFPPHADPATRQLEHYRPRALTKNKNQVMLGIFMPTSSWSVWATTEPTETEWTFDYNKRLVKLADEVGLHYAFPAARWKGVQGDKINWHAASLDTITAVGAFLEATKHITILSTVHTNLFNPVVAAKLGSTLDHISEGRFGLNIVSGWNEDEFKSMSIPFLDKQERYNSTAEWLHVVRSLWETGSCTFNGRFFNIENAITRPLPVQSPRPVIVNAGQSAIGMKFAATEVDYVFSKMPSIERFRGIAAEAGSKTGFISTYKVVLGKTQDKAEKLASDIFANHDRLAVRNMRLATGAVTEQTVDEWMSDPRNVRQAVMEDAIVGEPDYVADRLAALILEGKPDGLCLTLYNFISDLEIIAERVIPRISEKLSGTGMELAPPPALNKDRPSSKVAMAG